MMPCDEITIIPSANKESETVLSREHVETVSEREDHHSNHRADRLVAALRQRQGEGHHSKAQGADDSRQHEAMLPNATDERDRADDHGQRKADLVDDRAPENAAGRCKQPEEDRRRDTMDQAEA